MDRIFKNNIVKLKSGGPKMEVKEIDTNNYVFCSWRNKRDDQMFGSFPIHTIIKVQ